MTNINTIWVKLFTAMFYKLQYKVAQNIITKQGSLFIIIWYRYKKLEQSEYPAGNFMFKVNKRNTRTRCEIFSKLTMKTTEFRHWRHQRRSGVFIVNFEHISHLVLVFLLLTLSSQMLDGYVNNELLNSLSNILQN